MAQPPLVLVVDDDEGIRELLAVMIKKEGWRVETAEDGAEGERKALELKPALIVLDLMLPRYGGFELLKNLQGTELAKTPIVIVTGRYTDRSTAEMIRQESNVVELLEKPVKATRFILALQRILRPGVASGEAPPEA
ncbi:MAG TPA: response regulator [Elusimicrobiota bacterium]|nr:response regulator [Elusimicrobiota bacterium]